MLHGILARMKQGIRSYRLRPSLVPEERSALAEHSDIMAQLLSGRGITNAVKAAVFLAPDYVRDVHDPFLLKDALKAAERIYSAIKNSEKIAIYADYDADGIPGAVLWDDFFKRAGFANYTIYIPHRHDEGFGLNDGAVDTLAESGVNLLITVDCGIADAGPVKRANERGMDVIVTDHHEPPRELPPAFAIIDHKQADCAYPDKNLCGSGVAFKVVQAVCAVSARDGSPLIKAGQEKWLLDMVGIATLSDMVPLTGENRALAQYGLQVLRKSPRTGLRRLLDKLRMDQRHLTEDDVAFMITPRINAASRMGVPMDAFNLLSASDEAEASVYADHLEAINNERKGIVAALVKDIKKHIRERHGTEAPPVIVLGNPEWRPSLLGLAANSCAEEFGRPVFLWGRDGDNAIKGSCRSEGKTHVVELMRSVPSGVFTQFGGHRHSGGFAVASDEIHFLEKHLNEAASRLAVTPEDDAAIWIDAELRLEEVGYDLWDEIARLAPFGTGNPRPAFMFRQVRPIDVRRFGKANEHIELGFAGRSGRRLGAIAFFGAESEWAGSVAVGVPVDLVASPEKSMFRGRPELRLRIIDVL